MPELVDPDNFEFFARYLLAGYVVFFVRSAIAVGERPKTAELFVEAIILSLVVQIIMLIFSQLALALVNWESVTDHAPLWLKSLSDPLLLTIQVLLIPALLGLGLGIFAKSDRKSGILRMLSLQIVHPVRRAHDFAFSDRSPCLVEVTFVDGTKVAGWYGTRSLAATDDNRTDLFLERAYIIQENGDWKEPKPGRQVLLKLENVRSIEFLEAKGTES
jgi:hypothetical protein